MNFSIIIPCYNAEKTLDRTIESLLIQQEYIKNIILVDDGSTDNTAHLGRHYAKLYPDLIEYHHQKNQGPGKARNRGADFTKGKYTLFLDADDTLTPNCLQTFSEAFDKDSVSDILIGGYCSIHGDEHKDRLPTSYRTAAHLLEALWFKDFSLCGGATALRTHVLEHVRYPEEILHGEDIVFFSHLLAGFPSRTLSFVALNVHHRPDSLRHASASVLTEGEAIIPLLFNPRYLSRDLMNFQAQYHAEHLISLARVANKLKKYSLARNYLSKARKLYSASFYQLKPLKALFKSYAHLG
jgi:glycosyltransferase involved in cell wall biosynthesis